MTLPGDKDWTPLSDIQGDEAASEYQTLANSDQELAVTCEYTGDNKLTVTLGRTLDGRGYAYLNDTECGQRLMTSSEADLQALCQTWLQFLSMRRGLVNSDPRSPDYFETEPCLEELVESLKDKFGVRVSSGFLN